MDQQRLAALGQKLLEGSASPEELDEISQAVHADESGDIATRLHVILNQDAFSESGFDQEKWQAIAGKILTLDRALKEDKPTRILTMLQRMAVAAAILLFLGAGTYYLFFKQADPGQNAPALVKDVTAPSALNAKLTLANGEEIVLDSASNGVLSVQGNRNVVLNNGELGYGRLATPGDANETLYNTLTVPRGSKVVSLVLTDGSKVWLNSESSLRYPVTFSGSNRAVELTGEAYFEVAKNPSRPFVVSSGETNVKVLGTSFNVKAYGDEPLNRVTLVEGSVEVSKNGAVKTLIPGQQAAIAAGINIQSDADIEEALAWKNGKFVFNGSDIVQVMRELARWYDLDVVYTNEVKEKFYIEMTRNTNLSNVFKILEETGGVHFKIERKKITVMP